MAPFTTIMKTPPKLKEALTRIKTNKETLFAVLLAGTRWYTRGFALPLAFVVCRLVLDRLKDRNVQKDLGSLGQENQRLKRLLDDMNVEVIGRHIASGPEEDMSKIIVELRKERDDLERQLKAERQGKSMLQSDQKEAMAIRDAEARQNRIFKKEIERLQNDTQTMKDLESEIEAKLNVIANKERMIANLEQDSSIKQSRIVDLEEEKQKLLSAIDSEKESKASLSDALENKHDTVRSLEKALKETKKEIGEKRQLYEITMKMVTHEKEQSTSLDTKVQELTTLLEAEQKTVQEQQSSITMKDAMISSLKEYEYKTLKITEELRSKEDELKAMKKDEEFNKAVLSSTMKKLSVVEEENKHTVDFKQQVVSLTRSMMERDAKLETMAEMYNATKSELQSIRDANEALEKDYSDLKASSESSTEAKNLLAKEVETSKCLQNEVDALNESLKTAKDSNTHLQHNLDQKTTLVEAKQTLLTESTAQAESLQKQVDELKEQMTELNLVAQDADTIEIRASEAEALLLAEQAKTSDLKTKVEELTAIAEKETRKATEFEGKLENKQSIIEACEATIERLEGFKQKAEDESTRAQDIQSEVSRLNNYLGSMKLNVDALEESLEEREREIAELNAINNALASGKDQLSAKHTESKTVERQLQEQLERMKMDLSMEAQKFMALQNENEQLKEADQQTKKAMDDLKSSLQTKQLAIQRKDTEIFRLQRTTEENEKLQEKEKELYKKLDNVTASSNDVVNDLKANLEKTKASLREEQWKVDSLREMLESKSKDTPVTGGGNDATMGDEMKAMKSKYETEKANVVNLESTRRTSQKMIRDLESILDKKEAILAKKQEEIAALTETLAEVTESQSGHISEAKKREISKKISHADSSSSQKIKLSDMLIVSSAFHGSTRGVASPKGRPTPENMNPWGRRPVEN